MLGPLTEKLVADCCPAEQQPEVRSLLAHSCSHNLPGVGASVEWDELIDRIQLAAVRGSDWKVEKIKESVALANRDWRDLLVAADFANDLVAHKHWQIGAIRNRSVT